MSNFAATFCFDIFAFASCDVMSSHEGDDLSNVSVHSAVSSAVTGGAGDEGDPLKLNMTNRDPNNINDHVEVCVTSRS